MTMCGWTRKEKIILEQGTQALRVQGIRNITFMNGIQKNVLVIYRLLKK